jgi:hypothetical protein
VPDCAAEDVAGPHCDDDAPNDEANDRTGTVPNGDDARGVEQQSAECPHRGAEGRVAQGPPGVEQCVLAERVRRSPSLLGPDLVGIGRDERAAHPEAVDAPEDAENEEGE